MDADRDEIVLETQRCEQDLEESLEQDSVAWNIETLEDGQNSAVRTRTRTEENMYADRMERWARPGL